MSTVTTTAVAEIKDRADYLARREADASGRLANASKAGADLAAVVYAYTEDPQGVGLDALMEAHRTFMMLHSGNFYVGVMA